MTETGQSIEIEVMVIRRAIAGYDRAIKDLLLEREALAAKLPREAKRRGDATSFPSLAQIKKGRKR